MVADTNRNKGSNTRRFLNFKNDERKNIKEVQNDLLKDEITAMERYFINKILCYKKDFAEDLILVEKELEDVKMAHLNVLLKLKQSKDKIKELELKNEFYKKRLSNFERNTEE
jgi:hypothetical protein